MKVQWRDLLSSDFKRIEEVFGFELYDWQKKYLKGELDSFPNGRRNGKTFVTILKGLLLDEETFTITELKKVVLLIKGVVMSMIFLILTTNYAPLVLQPI